jgi:hypothetical protein
MCILLNTFRVRSYSHAMAQVLDLVGERSIWDTDLQQIATVRALAFEGRTGNLECLLETARFHAGQIGFVQASNFLRTKLAEVAALKAEARGMEAVNVDVVVLDDDWGKKGRGAKIRAWIMATGADASAVMVRFQLANSTATKYVREARKGAKSAKRAA